MKALHIVNLAALTLGLCHSASAEVLEFAFDATITSSGGPGNPIAVGTPVSGLLSVDTSATDVDARADFGAYVSPFFTFSANAGGNLFQVVANAENSATASDVDFGGQRASTFFITRSGTGSMLSFQNEGPVGFGTAVPQTVPALEAFSRVSISSTEFGTYRIDDAVFRAVPEPSTISLGLMALGALAMRRRKN